jgi:hypothetical protein
VNEEQITAAYNAAEFELRILIQRDKLLVLDSREPAKTRAIRAAARAIADSVIRTLGDNGEDADILTFPGVEVEKG